MEPLCSAPPGDDSVPAELAAAMARGGFAGAVHWRGNIALCSARPRIAMVGTRDPGVRSLQAMETLAAKLARAGAVVVSGAARGTDMASHNAAIRAGGGTIACVPGGLGALDLPQWRPDFVTPLAQQQLLLLSVFPPTQQISTQTPAIRNRLIAGLCEALVVGEAATQSGTHICTRAAMGMGLPVFFLAEQNGDATLAALHCHLRQRGATAFSAEEAAAPQLAEQIAQAAARHREALRAADEAQLRLF